MRFGGRAISCRRCSRRGKMTGGSARGWPRPWMASSTASRESSLAPPATATRTCYGRAGQRRSTELSR
eukprot:3801521-Alexandrium_andersonii.AAC.1